MEMSATSNPSKCAALLKQETLTQPIHKLLWSPDTLLAELGFENLKA